MGLPVGGCLSGCVGPGSRVCEGRSAGGAVECWEGEEPVLSRASMRRGEPWDLGSGTCTVIGDDSPWVHFEPQSRWSCDCRLSSWFRFVCLDYSQEGLPKEK